MSRINVEMVPSNVELKTRRTAVSLDVNIEAETIRTFFKEQKYYVDGADEILVGEAITSSWEGDFETWYNSDAGVAIKTAMETELAKPVPGV